MPPRSQFSPRLNVPIPAAGGSDPVVRVDLRGLDLSSPYDVMAKNRSPFARNFRIFAEEKDDRRVAITNRKGAGFYTNPQGEGISVSNTDVTGADYTLVGIDTDWHSERFVPTTTGPLTRIGIKMKSNGATGPLIVTVHADDAGKPGVQLAKSGILSSDVLSTVSYVNVRFIEAPTVTASTTYWYVVHMQNDGTGNYQLSTNTFSATALTSNTGGLSWEATTHSLNYNIYVSAATKIKALTRYAPSNSANATLAYFGNNVYTVNDATGNMTSIASGLNATATDGYFDFADDKAFFVNGYDTLKTWNGTTWATITHTQLPVLRLMTFHKNRLFGVSASDPNRLIFSEDPGNNDGAGNEWYNAYLSTSFIYVPTPKSSEPITAIVPFQDNLIVFTRSGKYVLYGSDPGSFTVRISTGKKGAVHQNAVFADENYIYFVADDGLYRFNGSEDTLISDLTPNGGGSIQPEFDNIADKSKVTISKWKRQVRFYYPSTGSTVNNKCLVFHTVFQEWMLDTDVFVNRAVHWSDGDDSDQLCEASSVAPTLYYAEQADHGLGRPIDFKYHCPYDSYGNPAQRKRITKFFPLLEGEGSNYTVAVGLDSDRRNNPRMYDLPLRVSGALIGQFNLDEGVLLGGQYEYEPARVRVSGYAYYWQVRVEREAINNPVQFVGYVVSIRAKRL